MKEFDEAMGAPAFAGVVSGATETVLRPPLEFSHRDQPGPALAPQELDLALLLSIFEAAPMPWTLVEAASATLGWTELDTARIMLYDRAIVQLADDGCYSLDLAQRKILQGLLAESLQAPALRQAAAGAIAHIAQQIARDPLNLSVRDRQCFLPHIAAALDNLDTCLSQENRQWCCIALGHCALDQASLDHSPLSQAEYWYKKGMKVQASTDAQANHPALVHNLSALAACYHRQGNLSAAHLMLDRALIGGQALWPDGHADLAMCWSYLASLYKTEKRFAEAEAAYQQAMSLREQWVGKQHPDWASSLNDYAGLYFVQGQYDRAAVLYTEALQLHRSLLGNTHATVAISLNNLASVFYARKQYPAAITHATEAVQISTQVWGAGHPKTQTLQNNLQAMQAAAAKSGSGKMLGGLFGR